MAFFSFLLKVAYQLISHFKLLSSKLIAETLALNLQVHDLIFCTVEQYWQSWEIMVFLEKEIFINMVS